MRHELKNIIALLPLIVLCNVPALCHGRNCSLQDTIAVLYVNDFPRDTGDLIITLLKNKTKFEFSYMKKIALYDFRTVSTDVDDIDEKTSEYIRKNTLNFYYYKNKRKYKYYKKLKWPIDIDPGPGRVFVKTYTVTGKKVKSWFYLTNDVTSDRPLCNGDANIIYSDEYKVFLVTLQKLVYKYTTKYKGPWHEVKPGYYGWYWWE